MIGKLHEISFYGLIASIVCLTRKVVTFEELKYAGFHVYSFISFFEAFLFWAMVLFLPIAIIGAFSTKYGDSGVGLTFGSNNILVIMFAHIAEEILGLFLTPFWFLGDLFSNNLGESEKSFDYLLYLFEIVFVAIGIIQLFNQ